MKTFDDLVNTWEVIKVSSSGIKADMLSGMIEFLCLCNIL